MKVAVVVLACLAAAVSGGIIAGPTTLVRTPSLDSAVIQSDRLGGNFAYSSVEGHAYAAVSPVVQQVVSPVAVSYTAHQVPVGAVGIAHPGLAYGGIAHPGLAYSGLAHPGLVHVAHSPIIPGIGASLIPGSGLVVAAQADAPAPAAPEAEKPAASSDAVEVESA